MIYPRQRERVFRTGLIQASVVDAHSPCVVLLQHQDWVRQLVRVENLHDEAGCKEPGDLFSDCAPLPLGEAAQRLFHRLCIRSHVKFVLGVLPRNTRHVLGGPCKDVPILTEEVDELAFLFGAEASPDGDALIWIGRVEWDLLGLFSRLERALAD